MKLEKVIHATRKVTGYFQRFQLTENIVRGGLFVLSVMTVVAVLTRTGVVFVFVAALCGGGWATSKVTSVNNVLNSRQLLQFLPDLVSCSREKRKRAGLSVLPNFEVDLVQYSVNGYRFKKLNSALNSSMSSNRCLDSVQGPLPLTFVLPDSVDEELQHLIKSVMQDFVLSWYNVYINNHKQESDEFLKHLLSTSENLCVRLASIKKRNLLKSLLHEFRIHVYRFQRAHSSLRKLRNGRTIDSVSLVASYEMFSLLHPAIQETSTETDFLRSVMDLLVYCAMPRTITQCRASTAIIVEILTCNVLLPLLNLLADPDFLYRLIILIVSSSSSENKARSSESKLKEAIPKKPVNQGCGNLPHQENNDISTRTKSDQSADTCGIVCAYTECIHKCGLQTRQKSATVDEMSKPRIKKESDQACLSPSIQMNREDCIRRHLHPSQSFPLFQSNVPSEESSLSSMVPASRSFDALVDPLNSTVSQNHDNSKSPKNPTSPLSTPKAHRRCASDSSCNPALSAFIPGDLNHGSSNPCIMRRPATEGAETAVDHLVVIPMTSLEPAITAPHERGNMARSSSVDSFASLDFEVDQLNTPFTDIDCQFSSDGVTNEATLPLGNSDTCKPHDEESRARLEILMDLNADENEHDRRVKLARQADKEYRTCESEGTCFGETKILPPQETVGSIIPATDQVIPAIDIVLSSPIKKFLRRISSKGLIPEPTSDQSTNNQVQSQVQESVPVPIPARTMSSQSLSSSNRQTNPQPIFPQGNLSEICGGSNTLVPTAKNSGIISMSAPETSGHVDLLPPSSEDYPRGLARSDMTNLLIPRAEVCKESGGKSEFFLYSIQFEVQPISPVDGDSSRPEWKTVKRRHREFVNLHSRMEHNPLLKMSLKGLRDVPKRLSFPLAPTAKNAIDQRRISLQHYLQQLLMRPLLHSSTELREFLALKGDSRIEYVRHQPREYVPRIDKLLRHGVSGLVDTFKSALPRALSDLGPLPPLPPITPPTSPIRKSKPSLDAGKKMLSPPGSPRPRSPLSAEEQETIERMFAFEKRPKTTIQLAMNAIIEDHSESGISNLASADNLNTYVFGPRSEGDGCESPDDPASESRSDGGTGVLGSEEVSLFDAVLCILGEAFHDKEAWFLDEGFQSVLTKLVGGLLDGWLEKQVHLLCSEHWCAFYLSELREVLWPGGELISAGQEVRTDAEKAVTRKEALESLINLLPESFYKLVDKRDWTEGLNLLLDSLGDPQLNRHLVFTALDLLMDALITEIKDEGFQRDLLSRV